MAGYAHDFTGFGTENQTAQQQQNQGYQGTYKGINRSPNDAAWNFGAAANEALQSGFSGQGQATTDYQDAIRKAALDRMGNYGANADQYKNQQTNWLDTQMQRGFNTQANALRRGSAGTGMAGSPGQARMQNNLVQSSSEARAKALQDLQQQIYNQGQTELQGANQVGQSLYGQQLGERQFQLGQAQDLANQYMQMYGGTQQQQHYNQARSDAEDQAKNQALGSILGLAGTAGGFAIGGPMGAAAGSQLGRVGNPNYSGLQLPSTKV